MDTTVVIGQRFGRAIVISGEPRRKGYRMWRIRCDCGTEKIVYHHCLYSGHTTSCGCLGREKRLAASTHHGHNTRAHKSCEYTSWWEMIQRCYRAGHISYKNYGGRGIVVCDRWKNSFPNFLTDLGLKPTPRHWLDRIDTNGNYEPGNCRWATPKEQLRNTRRNRIVEYQGKAMCMSELSEVTGILCSRLRWRIDNGWSVQEAVDGRKNAMP